MENTYLLSICIPTYNRLVCLSESLQILLPQAERHSIQICVSDNCSTDGTGDYLKLLAVRYKCLMYRIQEKNLGIDKNTITAMSMATAAYILPCGDDETIIDGSLQSISNKLAEKEIDLMILNGLKINSKGKYKRNHLPKKMLNNCVFRDPIEAFSKLWDKMPLGSFIVRRECVDIYFFEKFIGTSHAYTGMVWKYLLVKYERNEEVYIACCPEHVTLYRKVEKSYSSYTAKIHLYEIPQWFIRLPSAYHEISKDIFTQYLYQQSKFITLMKYRAIGQLTEESIDKFMIDFSDKQRKRALLLSRIPQDIARNILKIGVVLYYIRRRFDKTYQV